MLNICGTNTVKLRDTNRFKIYKRINTNWISLEWILKLMNHIQSYELIKSRLFVTIENRKALHIVQTSAGSWCWIQLSSVLYFVTHSVFFWDSLSLQKEPRENRLEMRWVIRLNESSVRDDDSGNSPSIPARSFSPYSAIIVMFLWCDRNTETCRQGKKYSPSAIWWMIMWPDLHRLREMFNVFHLLQGLMNVRLHHWLY